jgi:hypothetical protein
VIVWAKDSANQTVTNFTDTAALQGQILYPETTIGNDDSSWEAPFNISYELVRVQAIYLASEIGPARPITSLALNVIEVPKLPLHPWTIRMKHTPLSAYPDLVAWDRAGWSTVYQTNQTIETPGWITFPLSRPFAFNGTNHLMVDFSFMNTNSTFSPGSCAASDTTEARSLSQAYLLSAAREKFSSHSRLWLEKYTKSRAAMIWAPGSGNRWARHIQAQARSCRLPPRWPSSSAPFSACAFRDRSVLGVGQNAFTASRRSNQRAYFRARRSPASARPGG